MLYLKDMRMLFVLSTCLTVALSAKEPASPPLIPASHPYRHNSMRKSVHEQGATQYWIFEPTQPKPAKAPLVLFFHGYTAMNPATYHAWIEHLTRNGNIVIYPRYQSGFLTPPNQFLPNCITSVRDAMTVLLENDHVQPDTRHVSAVGHSAGGLLAIGYSAQAEKENLPSWQCSLEAAP
jgi:acetyl esterase/lipase